MKTQQVDPDTKRGAYRKFVVKRIGDRDSKHRACEFFVLDWQHDRFAPDAVEAYAKACEAEYPALAKDLRKQAAAARKRWAK